MVANNYEEYQGKIVRARLRHEEKEGFPVADYVGLVKGVDTTSIHLSPYTFFYVGDSKEGVVERLEIFMQVGANRAEAPVSKSIVLEKGVLATTEIFE